MRNPFTQAVAVLLASSGLAWGQTSSTDGAKATFGTPVGVDAPPAATVITPVNGSTSNGSYTTGSYTSASYATGSYTNGSYANGSHANGSCANDGCAGSRVWASAEFLIWWLRPGNLPTVIGAIPGNLAGVNPLPDDSIVPVFGGAANDLDYGEHLGYRFTLGVWLNPEQTVGIDGNYWRLQRQTIGFSGASDGDPVLGPTFFDPITGRDTIAVLSEPGRLTSTASARISDRMWGFEANARFRGTALFCHRLDWLFGFRHLQFDEDMLLASTSTFLPAVPVVGGNRLLVVDSFATSNRFYGAQIGLNGDVCGERWFLNWSAKLAVGGTHQHVAINGASTDTTPAGVVTRFPGGLLAQPSNIGTRSDDEFAALTEITINVGYRITQRLRTFIGYNFLYLNEVARVGDQIDAVDSRSLEYLTTFDPSATPTRPGPVHNSTYLWAQGINFGIEFKY